MSLEDFTITVFCLVAEIVGETTKEQKLRRRGFNPKLTDEGIITMEIIGEFLSIDTNNNQDLTHQLKKKQEVVTFYLQIKYIRRLYAISIMCIIHSSAIK